MTNHGRLPARTLFNFALALCAILAPLMQTSSARAQGFGGPPPATFTASITPATAKPGDKVTVTVKASIQDGYHLYSVVPVPPPGPQETLVSVTGTGITPVGKNTESAPKLVKDQNFDKELGLHFGTATFSQAVTIAKTAKAGKLPLTVSVRYMACTESSCLPPRSVTVTPAPVLTIAAKGATAGKTAEAESTGGTAAVATATLAGPAQKTGPVEWGAALSRADIHPGEAVAVTVTAKVDEGYHIYSVVPVPPPGPQETKLTVGGTGVTAAGAVVESALKQVDDPNFGKVIGMHTDTATFTQVVTVGKSAAVGKPLPLTVAVRYMACNDSSCLPPKTITLTIPALQVVAGPVRPEFTQDALTKSVASTAATAAVNTSSDTPGGTPPASGGDGGTPAVATAAPAAVAAAGATNSSESGSLGGFLLGAFGAGLLALITPCVFPMIPVTLAFFTKQAAAEDKDGTAARGSVVKLAATYSLGIVVAFTGIGAIMAATVGAAGANRLAANPWVNLVFAALFFVFAFALMEVFEIRPPAALQGLTMKGRSTGGALGVLFMGLTFVIAAFTCTAPFIGTVLVAAASAHGSQWVRPILGMSTFAAALALPFFLLALFPSLLAKMPRSGAWLSTVKGAMGFLELAAALKFLSNADLVWQWGLLTQPVLLGLWATIAVAAALWLAGVLRVGLGAPEGRLTPARGAWTAVFAAAAVYCFYGLTGRPLTPFVAAILPPADYGYGAHSDSDLRWLPTLEEGLAQAKAENRPIFIDFTGYSCTNCRWVERNVFVKPEIQKRLKDYVLVRLYTDDKDQQVADSRQHYQEKTFGTVALPLYAVLGADGKPLRHGDVAYFGGTLSPARFAENFDVFLNDGSASPTATSQVAKN